MKDILLTLKNKSEIYFCENLDQRSVEISIESECSYGSTTDFRDFTKDELNELITNLIRLHNNLKD